MNPITDERMQNYQFITEYLNSLSESEKRNFAEGEFHIDDQHAFYVKNNTVFDETVIHSELTRLAIEENFGGILLLFSWSDANIKNGDQSYNLFIELSEGLINTAKSRIEVIDGILWMHRHNYVHNDLYNNNIFKLGTHSVIGDFDRSKYTEDIFIKYQDITHFYAWLPKNKIKLFKHLLVTIPNKGRSVDFIIGEDKLISTLEINLISENKMKEKYKDPETQRLTTANIEILTAVQEQCDEIAHSHVITEQFYHQFEQAMIEISTMNELDVGLGQKSKKNKKNNRNKKKNKKSKKKKYIK